MMEMPDRPTVAIVNDDSSILEMLGLILGDEGYRVVACDRPDRAHTFIKESRPDLAIVDVRMPGAADWAAFDRLRADPDLAAIPCIVTSASVDLFGPRAAELARLGCETIAKPFDIDALLEAVQSLIGGADRTTASPAPPETERPRSKAGD